MCVVVFDADPSHTPCMGHEMWDVSITDNASLILFFLKNYPRANWEIWTSFSLRNSLLNG